jgi:hypothetical protein
MKKRNIIILIGIVTLLIIVVLGTIIVKYSPSKENSNETLIGGDKEEHGCLIGAGYSWNESVGACIREWELNENQREAARIAISPLSYYVTIIEVEIYKCPGCFNVKIQRNDNQDISNIRLNNWTYSFSCSDYSVDNCPDNCVVCPPCAECSSIRCNTPEFCSSIGFNKSWYEEMRTD